MPATAALVNATAGAHVIPTHVAKEEAQKEGTVRIASQVDTGVGEGEAGGGGGIKRAGEEKGGKKMKQAKGGAGDRHRGKFGG